MKTNYCKCGRVIALKRRKCGKCVSSVTEGTKAIVVLSPGNRGRNKRGIAAHKPDKIRTRRAPRQHVPGDVPQIRVSKW